MAAHPSLREGLWRIADPKITLASVASMVLGAAAAARVGPLAWGWLVATVVGIFFIEAAKNASGEIFDFDSGTDLAVGPEDRSPFSGGKRVLVDGLMTRHQAALAAALFYAAGAAVGLAIVAWREPRVLAVGAVGVGLAYFYHAPPLRLSYRGLGEPAVALTYGPLVAAGTYLVQRGSLHAEVVLLSLPLGLLIGNFLLANELPDAVADASAAKRTLVVRLGKASAARLYALVAAAAFTGLAALPLVGISPWVLLGFAGLPHAVAAARRLARHGSVTREVIPAQAASLIAFLLYSLGVSLGLALGR
ncbi:MAG TPA: prenyltransferase [Thermoanaerobaculia bacterium]|nr:prenyltransferase [Thermoanaerobaculia bacterium]